MLFAFIAFLVSLTGIIALFAVKYWELRREQVLAGKWRSRADVRAGQLKELMIAARIDLEKLPPEIGRIGRIVLHESLLAFASLLRLLERGAHRLAEFVSHKRGFEKRETRSEFLKKVAEHKNGGGERDAEASSEPNVRD